MSPWVVAAVVVASLAVALAALLESLRRDRAAALRRERAADHVTEIALEAGMWE